MFFGSENLAAGTGAYSINEMINDWVVEVSECWKSLQSGLRNGTDGMTLQRITTQVTRRRRISLRSVDYSSMAV